MIPHRPTERKETAAIACRTEPMSFTNQTPLPQLGRLRPEQLMQLKNELGLQMSPQLLQRAVQYYAVGKDRRNPTVGELRLLDALSALPPAGVSTALSELYTNEPFVAVTYADMMNKRRELHPEAAAPITLGEALGMATAYLDRAGRAPSLPGSTPAFSDVLNETGLLPDGTVGADGSGVCLTLTPDRKRAPALRDRFLLLHRGELPMGQYRTAASRFITRAENDGRLKNAWTVPQSGLLPLLLPKFGTLGLCFDLSALDLTRVDPTPTLTVGHFSDYLLLHIGESAEAPLTEAAKAAGLLPLTVALLAGDGRISFTPDRKTYYGSDSSFLAGFLPRAVRIAKLPSEAEVRQDALITTPLQKTSSPYLKAERALPERVAMGELSVSTVCCRTDRGFFRSAVWTVAAAALEAAVCGGKPEDTRIAISLELPKGEDALGASLATVLGVYRAQAELGLSSAAFSMPDSDKFLSPVLTVFSLTQASPLPSHLTASESKLYCVSPALDPQGLPDFDALRQLRAELQSLAASGRLTSARLVSGQTVADVAERMTTAERIARPEANALLAEAPDIPMLLLESAEALPYTCVGSVAERSEESQTLSLPAKRPYRIWQEQPEVTVYAKAADRQADLFAAELRQSGIICHRFDESSEVGPLSRAVLTSRCLILCSGELPQEDALAFALETQAAAGGYLLSMAGSPDLPADVPVLELSGALSESLLDRLLGKKCI